MASGRKTKVSRSQRPKTQVSEHFKIRLHSSAAERGQGDGEDEGKGEGEGEGET